jgi:hypothetical protein
MLKKMLFLSFPIGMIVGIYTAFVAMCYWDWFIVSTLHVPSIPLLAMVGIIWLIGLLADKSEGDDIHRENLYTVLDYCIPDDKREIVAEKLKENQDALWVKLVGTVFGKVVGNTLTLVVGFALHFFIS